MLGLNTDHLCRISALLGVLITAALLADDAVEEPVAVEDAVESDVVDGAPDRDLQTLECHILYETAEGFYVDEGAEAGLVSESAGWLDVAGQRLGRVEVLKVARGSALLRLVSEHGLALPAPGETVRLQVPLEPPEVVEHQNSSPTWKVPDSGPQEFVPLLAPPQMGEVGYNETQNVFQGRIGVRQLFQVAGDNQDYYVTRFRVSGSLERIDRTPWALEWSGDFSYRAGDGLQRVRDYEEIRAEIYRLALFRRFDDRSFIRLGRFLPRELPSIGYVDGVHGEYAIDETFRLGGVLGLKPVRDRLDPSIDEPLVSAYATVDLGEEPDLHWSATGGVLFSAFNGSPDRLAVLVDQRAQLGSLSIYSSSEIDFDVGGTSSRSGTRLSRLDLFGSYPIASWLELRAGVNRFEIPDTEGERDVLDAGGLFLDEFLENDYWRYWVGASHELFWGLRLSEEVSYTDSDSGDDIRWLVSLTRTGLPGSPDGTVTLSAFTLAGVRTDGYGARLSAFLPFLDHELSLQPSIGFRMGDFQTRNTLFFDSISDDLLVADVSLHAHWMISRSWVGTAGLSYTMTDDIDAVLLDFSLAYRW